jgi:transketolase
MSQPPFDAVDQLCVNTIRTLSIDAVQKANSGHPGLPMGAAPMGYVLWQRHLRHDPQDQHWPDRDRFVLSGGHGVMLHYSLLHLTGHPLSMDELKAFRQWGSRTPGHPESHLTPGIEATTGPLGQGTANAVGMAMAERALAHRYNRPGHTIVDHRTFAIVTDGDMMEGISHEAASLAGHLKLGKLTFLYDSNLISLDGPTSMAFTEDVRRRYEGYGWRVLSVDKGDTDFAALDDALVQATADASRPTFIFVRTTIGYGSPHKAGTSEAHGSPLGPDEVKATKKALGWDPEKSFFVPDEAHARFTQGVERGRVARQAWRERFDAWAKAFPDLAEEWRRAQAGELPEGWDRELPSFKPTEAQATRQAGGKVLNALAQRIPWLLGGDADLSVSTSTALKDMGPFEAAGGSGRNIHFGVREHTMAGIANGMAYHGGIRPFTATFFVFSDYMRPSVRIAALAELPVVHVWTHDSIGLGEDGPTHQPVEHLASLRAMPNLWVVRPCDANETTEAWVMAMRRKNGPTGLVLTRQKLPVLDRTKVAAAAGVHKGAYVLADPPNVAPKAILIATGSEVHVALAAQALLANQGVPVRVVSMPCWQAFAGQSDDYREEVLPPEIHARVSIEAGATFGWREWIGEHGVAVGLDRFGASAPGEKVMEELGFSAEKVAAVVRRLAS